VVPDVMAAADLEFAPLNAWDDKLLDISDIVEPLKADYAPLAIESCNLYNSATKKRSYYMAPVIITGWPFHIWGSLVEKGGGKISELPNTWEPSSITLSRCKTSCAPRECATFMRMAIS